MNSKSRKRLALVGATLAMLALPVTSIAADEGASLFKSKCAMCHGPDGSGKTIMGEKLKIPDLHSADVQKKSDADLKTIITKGKDKMPAYETKLSKEQVDSLVAFIRDLAKKNRFEALV
jgi:mono/diheme cytochrome c family protein